MPIFGLVWVASWVGCFFPSSQDLLQTPIYQPSTPSVATPNGLDASVNQRRDAFTQTRFALSTRLPLQASHAALADSAPSPQAHLVASNALHPTSHPPAISGLVGSLRNFFLELGTIAAAPIQRSVTIAPLPQVMPSQTQGAKADWSYAPGVGFAPCRSDSDADASSLSDPQRAFQIKVGGKFIGAVALRQQAKQTAERLKQVLSNPNLQSADLRPAIIKGLPAVRLGDRLLFTINGAVAQSDRCNTELTAISWVNNLRVALAETPLSLSVAQQRLYGLQETSEKIEGLASWYGPYFHGRQTATGEIFDQDELTAAHPSLPFNTFLKVKNVLNGKTVIVRVNDRGPYIGDRTLDLSREAARLIDSENTGVVPIEAVIMQAAPISVTSGQRIASRL